MSWDSTSSLLNSADIVAYTERTIFSAILDRKIQGWNTSHEELKEVAKLPDFVTIAKTEAATRGLGSRDVLRRARCSYGTAKVRERENGNDDTITLRAERYDSDELAALIAYLKLQATWTSPLAWKLVEKDEKAETEKEVFERGGQQECI